MQRPNPETTTLAGILITEELSLRVPRVPNWRSEAKAMRSLAQQMARDSQSLMQILADTALELCEAGTAGVSLLETTPNGEEIFRWTVLAGTLAYHVDGSTPRNFSPCGVCLEQGSPVLFSYPERYFTYFQEANTPIVEGLVLPLIADSHVLGTIWIMSHDKERHFDSEDVRVMTSLADFTATALLLKQRQTGELLATNATLETEIVERKQVESALRESEAFRRLAVKSGRMGTWRWDCRSRQCWGDAGFLSLWGVPPSDEKLPVSVFTSRLSPEGAAALEAVITKDIAPGEEFDWQLEVVAGANAGCWIRWRGQAERETPWIINGVSFDVTEQKRAEVALRQSQARLQSITNLVPDLLWDSEPDGSTNWYNQRWMEYTGQTFEQAIGWGWTDAIHPDDREGSARHYREAVEQGMPLLHEHRIRRHDGAYRWFVLKASPLKDESGKVIKMYGAATDIHEQRVALEALQESEAKYRSLFQSIDEGYAVVEVLADDNGEWNDFLFLEVNTAFEQQTGMVDSAGRKATEILGTPNPAWAKIYGRVAETGEPVRFEENETTLERVFDLYAFRLGKAGSRRVAVLFTDITERKRAEETLRESEKQQAFLLKFSDALRAEPDADAVANRAIQMLFEQMQLDRCYIGVYRIADDRGDFTHQVGNDRVPPLPDGVRLSDFPKALRVAFDRTLVINDVAEIEDLIDTDRQNLSSLGLRALVAATLRKGENNPLWSIVSISAHPRCWTRGEIALVEEVTERTWAAMERARAEASLRNSEAKYRSLFEAINDGFALLEVLYDDDDRPVDCRLLEISPSFEAQTGLPQAQGKTLRELVPSVESGWFEHYHQALVTNALVHFEMWEDYLKTWFEVDVLPYGNSQDRQVMIVLRNINDRKRAEARLRRAAQMDAFRVKLSDALRSLSDPVQIQSQACRLLGEQLGIDRAYYVEVHEAEGYARVNQHYSRGDSPLIVGDYRLAEYGWSLPIMRRGETIVIADTQSTNIIPDAERAAMARIRMIGFVAIPLVKGEVLVGALAVNEPAPREWTEAEVELVRETAERIWADIQRAHAETALHKSELERVREQSAREQERQRAEALTELDRAKTLFFSNVSHEFRTPLTLILAPVQDALSDAANPLPGVQRERLELVQRNTLRLLKLVNTLLDFSRIEAGRMEAVYEPTDLAMYTTELAGVFRSVIEQAGLRLVVDCPPLAESVYVDRQMWEKIVLNLLSNAFKFTFEGEIAVRLHLVDDHHVMLQVQDTGIGIEPEQMPYIMKRFYQVRAAKARTHEGSGIGLALVHELIKLHGGTIDLTSTPGVGSCFTVTIGLGTAHLPNDHLQLDVGEHTTATRTLRSTTLSTAPYVQEAERWIVEEGEGLKGKGKKDFSHPSPFPLPLSPSHILIVDDNADMRDYLTRILSEHHEVIAVADGAAALAAVNERVPDLVLSDVMMPELDGFELLKALRADARTKEIPIILLSARAGEESVIEGLLAGADDYLIKPFSANELVTRINAYLQMAQMRSQALHQERTINRRKDEVLSVVSHELNTPLVAILGWTRLLQSNPPSPAMLFKALETIERNATLQAKLVEDLLDISRITAGKICLNQEPVQLQGVIETTITTVRQLLETKEIQFESTLEPSPVIVQGDPQRLQQIILNLLTNAVKFTSNGGKIAVSLQTHAYQAQITVTDTGCGIDAEFLPYIFDTFRQASGTEKGLGLGLAIALRLVELHDGTIVAHSPGVGQGTTFTVMLPLMFM